MAVDIGPKIGIKGEAEYRRSLQNIIQSQKTLNAEMKASESAWDKNTSASKKAAKQSEQLNKAIDQQKLRISSLEFGLERASNKFGETDTRTLKWKQALAEARTELNRLEAELRAVPNSLQLLGQKMQDAGERMQSIGRGMTTVGGKLTRTVTAPIVAIGTAAVKTTADFDESMSKVMALSGATGDEFAMLRDKARDLGKNTKFSAGEAADAMSYMALAGWDSAQMMEGLDGVLDLAAASGMDLASASDLVTDYLSAFGLEAKDAGRMADELAYAQAHSNTTTTQLGEAFGNSAAQMNTAGQSMETTTAILEAFANQGLKGSEAGTALSAMMRDITQKMKNGKIQIGDTSIAVKDQNGNFRSLVDILADVETATEGMGSAEKSAALMQTFTARSVKGVSMALTEGIPAIQKYERELYSSQGAAKTMAEVMQNNLKGQLTILKSQMQELGISIGDILVPSIRKAVEWVQEQVDKLNELDKSTKEQIVKFGLLAAAIGPVVLIGGKLVTAVGSIVSGAGKAIEWIGKLSAGFSGAESAAGAFSSVIGPLGLAVGGVVTAVALAKAGYENFRQQAKDTNQDLYDSIDAVNGTTESLENAGDSISQVWTEADEAIQNVESTARAATKIAEEIEELTSKTKLTSEEQMRLKVLVGEMNALYPEMGLAIDDTTGSLNMSTDAIRDYIREAYKMAKVEAYTTALKAAMTAMADAEFKAAQAGVSYDRLLEERAELENQVASATEERDGITWQAALTDTKAATEKAKLNDEITTGNVALEDAQKALDENKKAQEENAEAVNESQKAYDDAYKVLEELAAEMGVSVDELLDMTDAAEDNAGATEELGDTYAETADDIESATKKIREAYKDAADSAKDSIMTQTGLWEQLEDKGTTSVENMIAALESHETALTNWNKYSSELLGSTRYQTDETFRNMVNSVIRGGLDLAPELQVIYELWASGDEQLDELVSHYGNTENLAQEFGENTAEAETVAKEGLDAVREAFDTGFLGIENTLKERKKAVETAFRTITKVFPNLSLSAGIEMAKNISKGMGSKSGNVENAWKNIKSMFKTGINDIEAQAPQGEAAGETVTTAIGEGENTGNSWVKRYAEEARKAVSDKIDEIKKLPGQTAGETATKAVATGINNKKPSVQTASQAVSSDVKQKLVTDISGYQTGAKNAAEATTGAVETGVNNKKSAVGGAVQGVADTVHSILVDTISGYTQSATDSGSSVAGGVSSGISSQNTNVSNSSNTIADTVYNGVSRIKNYDGYTWGSDLIGNIIAGVSSRIAEAEQMANRAADVWAKVFHHSTPDEGPLKHDDVWGAHMMDNLINGMRQKIPELKSVAMEAAEIASMPMYSMDVDAISGRNMSSPLTAMDMSSAFIAAAEQIDWRVVIGNREFGRILREQGAFA